nr:RNA-directed DNA polymerase [uncultured Undibacterium sp.]
MRNNKYILLRPVNALKSIDTPSYLGARIRLEQSSPLIGAIHEVSVQKKMYTGYDWAYKKSKIFKCIKDGVNEYRDVLVPSPLTSSAEAYLLEKMSRVASLQASDRVYSYKLSKDSYVRNYESYYPWYEKRNQQIHRELKKSRGSVALIMDIKEFYSTIEQELLLKQILTIKSKEVDLGIFIDFTKDQLSRVNRGIPIGTELSHFLANIYLKEFDLTQEETYKARYFRYVDDIVVICQPSETQSILDSISKQLNSLGLKMNDEKTEIMGLEQWHDAFIKVDEKQKKFHSFFNEIKNWVQTNQEKASYLEEALSSKGFAFPIEKMRIRSKEQSNLDKIYNTIINAEDKISSIVNLSERLRREYYENFEKIFVEVSNNKTRWNIKLAKKSLSPCFYLESPDNYKKIIEAASIDSELFEQKNIAEAISKNKISLTFEYPGKTMLAACELWTDLKPRNIEQIIDPECDNECTRGSIETARTFGIAKSPTDENGLSDYYYLRDEVKERSGINDKFKDEIESLRIGLNKDRQMDILKSRYSKNETMEYSILELGGYD